MRTKLKRGDDPSHRRSTSLSSALPPLELGRSPNVSLSGGSLPSSTLNGHNTVSRSTSLYGVEDPQEDVPLVEHDDQRDSSTEGEEDLPTWLPFANAFSGGVFLSAAFSHLLPEVAEWKCCGDLSVGLSVAGVGFFLLLALDSLSHVVSSPNGAAHSHSHSIGLSDSSDPSASVMRKAMLLIVLCFHSVLAGNGMLLQLRSV